MKVRDQNGFTLIEISVVVAILAALSLMGLRLYKGYQRNSDANLLAIEVFNLKKKLAFEANQVGTVQWSQFFSKRGYSNPQILSVTPEIGTQYEIGYAPCGANFPGVDCLTVTISGVRPDEIIDVAINDHINSTHAVCTHPDTGVLQCSFTEP